VAVNPHPRRLKYCPNPSNSQYSPDLLVLAPVLRSPTRFRSLTLLLLIAPWPSAATADDFAQQSRFFAKLSAPMTSIVDGKSFRDGLSGIAKQAQINLWIDRKIDPTAPIEAGSVGQPVFASIQKLAAKRDCAVMPVANVLLVGRPAWVDRTAASVLSLQLKDDQGNADISWDDLTTPADALAQAAEGSVKVDPELPHDLWPATNWKQIDRRVAVTLVLAQFDRRPESTASLRALKSVDASDNGKFTRPYPKGNASEAIRSAMSATDRTSRVRAADGRLEATGNIAAHRAAIAAMFAKSADAAAPDPDKIQFSIKARATAEAAFMQLSQAARRTCVIDSEAREACQQIVEFEGKDVTLRNLFDRVAEQAGVVANWQGDKIVISRKK